MRIFLTGAGGYVGAVVAEQFRSAGHLVLALAHNDVAVAKFTAMGMEVHRGDLLQVDTLREGARKADAVCHVGSPRSQDFSQALEQDRQAALAMLGALEGTGKPFVFTSGGMLVLDRTVGVASDRIVTEDMPVVDPPAFLLPRLQAEREVQAAADRNVRSVVLRLAAVYGRGGSALIPLLLQTARQMGAAWYIGKGDNMWPHVHVEDVARCFVLSLERASAGSLFQVAGTETSMKALAESVARAVGLPGQTKSVTLEEAAKVFGPFAGPMAANGRMSSAKARKELGWAPTGPPLFDDIERGSYAHGRQGGI